MSRKSINSSIQKIIEFTSTIASSLNPQNLMNVPIPGVNLNKLFGRETAEGDASLSDITNALEALQGDIVTGINIAICPFVMGGGGYAGLIQSLVAGSISVIASIADTVIQAVAIQINGAIMQIVGAITSIISALHNLVTSVTMLCKALYDIWDNFSLKIFDDIEWELAAENCKDMYAAIAGCFLNKFLGPYLDEFKEKALAKINEEGAKFNDLLYDELTETRVYTSYAQQEAFLIEKARLQITGLRPSVLSAGSNQ